MCYAQRWLRVVLAVAITLFAVSVAAAYTSTLTVLNLDHASICGSDLNLLQQAFTEIGLKPDYGGPHGNGGTHMAFLAFDDGSYLELIAPQSPGSAGESPWARQIAADAGPCAWAVLSGDIEKEVERLKAAGVPVEGPNRGSRKRTDGLSIEWLTANVGGGTQGAVLPFVIEDRTPREWRVRPSDSVKDSGLTGIDLVMVAVNDLKQTVDRFRKAYGWSEPLLENHPEFGARMAYFPGEPVLLLAATDGKSWINERLQKSGEAPVGFLLLTQDLTATAKKFRLSNQKQQWFAQRVAWFDSSKLKGVRLGVIGR